jgi:tetratricopeptide (TPR) repeat protein
MMPAERHDRDFEQLLDEGRRHLAEERLEEALFTYEEAEGVAQARGDQRCAELAFVNRCAVLIPMTRAQGLPGEVMNRLREILMAGRDDVNCFLAAYNVARTFEFVKEHRKGLFYARIALDRSRVIGSVDWLASSHNQIGNLLLAGSRFEAACGEYEEALRLLPAEPSRRKALILTNLGYALVVLERPEEGLRLIYQSLRMLRVLGARREQVIPHLDLSFALLEVGRFRHAVRHGTQALALAEEAGEPDSIKQALFLLGEATHQAAGAQEAREFFQRLQERYFPDASYLADVLLAVDVRKLINLKA